MAQSRLLTVQVWQKKSFDTFSKSKDRLIFAVNKGFDAMAAVLSKDSDPEEVQCALEYLSVESSLALKFDKARDDPLRDLVYGLLESLHGSLKEWTEERNQVKETGEIFTQTDVESTLSLQRNQRKEMGEISTQTDEGSLLPLLATPLHEASLPIDNNASNDLSNPPPSFPTEPKEESLDDYPSLPHDYQISASELMRDEKMFMGEDMDNENTELVTPHSNPIFNDALVLIDHGLNITRSLPLNSVVDPMDISQILPRDNQIVHRDSMEGEINLEDVEIQPSDAMDDQMNFDDEISGDHVLPLAEMNSLNRGAESDNEIDGEKRGLSTNDLIDNEGEDEAIDHLTDTPIDTSGSVKKEKRRRSSRPVSRPIQYTVSMENSDGDIGPSVKKSKFDSTKDDNKMKSYKGKEESEEMVKKRRVSKKNDPELECAECEFRTWSVRTWMDHLRLKHNTSPLLAGFALLCECGHESLSDKHSRTCALGNITVIRKRDGPIRRLDDEKVTPHCVLCKFYPKTARGYVDHLYKHHKTNLVQNGVYLKCSCGLEIRSSSNWVHVDECNPRQFTLHKLDDK